MAEQSTITLSGLPTDSTSADAADVNTPLTQLADEFNKQVPLTKLSAEQSWTTYSPSWTASSSNPAIGNGTLTGAYQRTGRAIHFRITLIAGTTTTYGSGYWYFEIPITAESANYALPVYMLDSGTQHYACVAKLYDTTRLIVYNDGNTVSGVTGTSPFTWASSDTIIITGTYQSAS